APTRVQDSRPATKVGPFATPWTGDQSRAVKVAGVSGVPAGAKAVVLNVTVTDTTASSYLTVSPSGLPRPLASSLNWTSGQTVANAVTVAVGTNGTIDAYNLAGHADVIIDIAGWYDNDAAGVRYHPVAPTRVQDSRPATKVGPFATPW